MTNDILLTNSKNVDSPQIVYRTPRAQNKTALSAIDWKHSISANISKRRHLARHSVFNAVNNTGLSRAIPLHLSS